VKTTFAVSTELSPHKDGANGNLMPATEYPWLARSRKTMISFAYPVAVPLAVVHIARAASYHPTRRNDKRVRNRSYARNALCIFDFRSTPSR
jgi:hypothetical protein